MPKQQETEWVTIGQVVAFFGLRGDLKVRLLTDIPNRFEQLKVVYLGPEHRRYRVESAQPYKGEMVLLKLAGINDATAAEALRHLNLLIPASELAALPVDSYYQHDILGLTVLLPDGRSLGTIVDILETGSNDVYIIKSPDGKQLLIPAIKEVVKQVDLSQRIMSIDPLPGLLDAPAREDEELETDEERSGGDHEGEF